MKFITIGGVPAAGKTYTSKLLAKQNNFLALELETLRWDFFNNNLEENLYKYTQHASIIKTILYAVMLLLIQSFFQKMKEFKLILQLIKRF